MPLCDIFSSILLNKARMTNDQSRDSAETNEIDVPKGPAGRPRRHCFLFYKSYHTSCIIPSISDRRYILFVVFDWFDRRPYKKQMLGLSYLVFCYIFSTMPRFHHALVCL